MRWRAERWMKVRHMRAVVRHDPWFVLRYGRRMLAHTFRGSTWRSAIGLEDAQVAFARYKAIRRREREYLDWPGSIPDHSLTDDRRPGPLGPGVIATTQQTSS